MPIESFVGRDGSARIVIDGRETKFRAPSLDEARDKVRDMAVAHAIETNTAQHFIAYDPQANWEFYIYPNGTMTLMPTRVIAPKPTAPQEPMPAAYYTAAEVEETVIDQTVVIPRKAPRPTLLVHVEGSTTQCVAPPVVLGRRPREIEGHMAVILESPSRECSRTHAVIDVDDECRVIVTDHNSANGTTADGTPLAPDTPTVVPNGVRLQLGDVAVRIEATPPEQSPGDNATASAVASHKEEAS